MASGVNVMENISHLERYHKRNVCSARIIPPELRDIRWFGRVVQALRGNRGVLFPQPYPGGQTCQRR